MCEAPPLRQSVPLLRECVGTQTDAPCPRVDVESMTDGDSTPVEVRLLLVVLCGMQLPL